MALEYVSFARAIGRTVLRALWASGYSANTALRWLVKEGYGYRRQDFLADWRELISGAVRERFFSEMPKYVRPTIAMMTTKASPVGDKYVYTYKMNLYDEKTGKLYEDQSYSIGEEKIISIQEAEDELIDYVEQYPEELKVVKSTLINVKRR